ncbi:hypothetical protein FHW83_001548 [Duganella sp. SG902]|uniref:PhaM family polyhydroxyalkanoate granule multifunctional regulatory protein n=1 Tax=Duganella sp. SG902 TaxID=2587016 RepID=UPI0018197741|nr:PhaM family polyhydroxyalkanoate granule multifunctional regulatory protein [Duganella sp. SG902]NVM75761.1 hypothetical protein [Duganella sp. SG902]
MAHNPMNDTLDFVKNLWGSMSVPGLTAPTLSVEELDKKINDLKAVESWLNLNMSMLRGSIQALEVQRGTIATLKSVGASLASAVNTGVNDKSIFDANPYASAFFHHAREADKAQATPEPEAKAQPEPEAKAEEPKAPPLGAGSGQPNAWWNLLQEQFKQAVSTAMASESMMTDAAVKFAAAAAGAGAKPAATRPEAASGATPGQAPAAVKKPPAKKPAAKKPAAKPAAKPAGDK